MHFKSGKHLYNLSINCILTTCSLGKPAYYTNNKYPDW